MIQMYSNCSGSRRGWAARGTLPRTPLPHIQEAVMNLCINCKYHCFGYCERHRTYHYIACGLWRDGERAYEGCDDWKPKQPTEDSP